MPLNNTRHNLITQRLLTRDEGEHVQHFAAMPCSCRISVGGGPDGKGEADPTCLVCGGTGRTYRAAQRIKGLIATISNQDKALLQAGLAMPGDLTFSPEVAPTIPIHDYDVIRLGYGMAYEGDVLLRGADRLAYLPARVLAVERHDPATGAATAYAEGVDYSISGQSLVWASGRGPATGAAYSVRYDAIFDWVVYPGVTLQRLHRSVSLGQRVLLRKRHLAGIQVMISAPVAP